MPLTDLKLDRRNMEKQCDVCENTLKIDAWGNGTCKKCGWNNDKYSTSYPNAINPPNFISLTQAKRYFKLGKSFLPTYSQFLNLVKRGFDFTFKFEKKSINYQFMMTILFGRLIQTILCLTKHLQNLNLTFPLMV